MNLHEAQYLAFVGVAANRLQERRLELFLVADIQTDNEKEAGTVYAWKTEQRMEKSAQNGAKQSFLFARLLSQPLQRY